MGETYSLRMEGKTTVTAKIMNRWNIEKMIEEPLMGRVEGDLFYGMSNKMEHLKVIAQLEKSEELKKEIRQSPEYKMCKSQQGHQEIRQSPEYKMCKSQRGHQEIRQSPEYKMCKSQRGHQEIRQSPEYKMCKSQ